MNKYIIGIAVIIIGVLGLLLYAAQNGSTTTPDTNTVTPGTGQMNYVNASADTMQVDLPFPNAVVGTDFTVRGKARGPWYFEASFPVVLVDKDGKELAVGIAQAEGEWMTNDFVPFKADLSVTNAYQGQAMLILQKDNPSGLSENDASVSFPVVIQ